MEERIIEANVTKDNIVIKIPNSFIINGFNEDFGGIGKVKYKNKFLKEFAKEVVEWMINNDILADVNEALSDSDNIKWLDDEEDN